MTPAELRAEVEKFPFWYHKIDLGQGVVTPGLDFDHVWDLIRSVRSRIDYTNKSVLDLASFDGMFAFEAERLGARQVIAADTYFQQYKNFLFCRGVLGSNVLPFYNVPPHDLWNRLDVYLQEDLLQDAAKPYDRLFDVVQHMGLLYHLRDPLATLAQSRSVLKTGGHLLLETAVVTDQDGSFMLFNGTPHSDPQGGRIYADMTTWWAPTIRCLKEMLQAAMFEPIEESIQVLQRPLLVELGRNAKSRASRFFSKDPRYTISRVALIAKAIPAAAVHREYFKELARTYRNPFLIVEHLQLPYPST